MHGQKNIKSWISKCYQQKIRNIKISCTQCLQIKLPDELVDAEYSSFFHLTVALKIRRHTITTIDTECGRQLTAQPDIWENFTEHFHNKLGPTQIDGDSVTAMGTIIVTKSSPEVNATMLLPIRIEQLIKAVQKERNENLQDRTVCHISFILLRGEFSREYLLIYTIKTFQNTNLVHILLIFKNISYITRLNMFRAARCSSSGGPIVLPQPLVSSPSVSSRTVCGWRADCSPLSIRILYGCLQRMTIPEAVVIQLVLLMMSSVLLETCWGV